MHTEATVATTNPFRLPRTVTPSRYDLTMSPDLNDRTFVGRVAISVTVHEPVSRIVCNASQLEIASASVVDKTGARIESSGITVDAEAERVSFDFPRTIEAGSAVLTVNFSGVLNDRLCGFYASTYNDDAGTTHTIATTQFESTDARLAFPCWDEPDLKAVFSVTLVVAPHLMAVSNSPVLHESTLASGKRSVTFADTMVMSTYLLCFVVGELEATEAVDVDGVPLRVIHRPGLANLTEFGLEIGAFALRYFSTFYDIAYPGLKMDLIALPDFAAGAMENVGAVTFREMLLLVDPNAASHAELERIADVVAHEIAHMWFGDLVTMKWWNGLWLNEAFATYAEIACVAAFRPEWDRWTSFGVYRAAAMQVDSLHSTRPIEFPVVSPTDAEGMFDILTYEKGASILRMLEQYLGEDVFRDGVRAYLREHSYGNAETTDLFDALERVSGQPVSEMMNGWVFTGGYPLVRADSTSDGVELSQQPFTYLPGGPATRWMVPVMWRSVADDGSATDSGRALVHTQPESVSTGERAMVVNSGGHGFYRVRYDDALASRLRPHLPSLAAVERFGVVSDTWASVLAGTSPSEAFVTLVRGLGSERDPNVWSSILGGLGALDQIADSTARPLLQTLVRGLCNPALEELGWEVRPGESTKQSQLRGTLIGALGGPLGEDPAVRSEAARLVGAAIDGTLAPDVAAAVVNVAAREGDASLWERYDEFRRSASPLDAIRYLQALSGFEDKTLAERTVRLALGDQVRTQDSPYLFIRMLADRVNGPVAWPGLRDAWTSYSASIASNAVGRLIDGLVQRTEPGLSAEIAQFFADNPVPQAEQQVRQKLELLRVYQALRDREGPRLATVFAPQVA